MVIRSKEEDRLTQYILGGLSEREREQVEAEFFEDDDAFEQMLIAEEELTDAYVRGGLSAEERARFEKSYLSSTRGCERVQFARTFAKAVSDARAAPPPPVVTDPKGRSFLAAVRAFSATWRVAFAAAALVVVVGFTWLLVERARMRDELAQLRGEHAALVERARESERRAVAEQARNNELMAQLEGERVRPLPEDDTGGQDQPTPDKPVEQTPRPSVLAFVLTPGLVRGGGARTLAVPAGTSSVALRLNVEAGTYQSYRAVIESADGQPIWRADSLKPRRSNNTGASINLPSIPARVLPPGDYVLLLSGLRPDGGSEGVADYSFKVVRR
ncbi:MAG TPA: hypothetical protein VF297_03775 [Pyrinomonadaceae bacterium]